MKRIISVFLLLNLFFVCAESGSLNKISEERKKAWEEQYLAQKSAEAEAHAEEVESKKENARTSLVKQIVDFFGLFFYEIAKDDAANVEKNAASGSSK
ncbi:MAG: hypothetical protein IJL70_00470 [Treponema sp.]|nr:hypothetical protein [Treponema sp.]